MKKVVLKRMFLVLAVFAMICLVSTVSHATGDINELLQDIPRIDPEPTTTTQEPENEVALPTTDAAISVDTKSDTEKEADTNKTLPKTGVDDTMLWVLIGVSVVAAGYTYKKVRDYNV